MAEGGDRLDGETDCLLDHADDRHDDDEQEDPNDTQPFPVSASPPEPRFSPKQI